MDDLNVQQNNQENKPVMQIKKFVSLPKFIFLVLGLILLAELIYAIRVLTLPAPPIAGKVPLQSKVGTISLNVPKNTYRINEIVPVAVNIETGSQAINGVDVVIHYDPKVLEATSGGLIKGRLFEEYPTMIVDASKGLIAISGINSLQNVFKGTGQFATINFKTKIASGKTSLTVDFKDKGSTIDSNLVEASTAKDIVEQVVNLELVVQ
ncbi:MAG: cohesin domain-containing protein [Candidatus Daviesbacteria bacterium]|nr:cohesin domain-containing protein [Candidatus Daviesbacteria bacterium]